MNLAKARELASKALCAVADMRDTPVRSFCPLKAAEALEKAADDMDLAARVVKYEMDRQGMLLPDRTRAVMERLVRRRKKQASDYRSEAYVMRSDHFAHEAERRASGVNAILLEKPVSRDPEICLISNVGGGIKSLCSPQLVFDSIASGRLGTTDEEAVTCARCKATLEEVSRAQIR